MPLVSSKYIHIFDCDGVLLDSNFLKLDALSNALAEVGAPSSFIELAIEEFRSNFGRTRNEHFKVFKSFVSENGFDFNDYKKQIALNRYSDIVMQLYKDCKIIEETQKYIERIKNFYVISASDQKELKEILPNLYSELKSSYIFGGPVTKIKNIKMLQAKYKKNVNFIFYGDSVADAKAALSTNINFIGLIKYSADPDGLKNFCNKNNLIYFNTCSEINL